MQLFQGNTIPLQYQAGLCVLPIRTPTEWELANIDPITITSGVPWRPASTENDADDLPDHAGGSSLSTDPPGDGGLTGINSFQKGAEDVDWEHIRKCLGYKPLDICQKTLQATTQYARNSQRLPLKEHYKSRFPALNCKRLNEIYATDTFFSLEKALGGITYAQISEVKHHI